MRLAGGPGATAGAILAAAVFGAAAEASEAGADAEELSCSCAVAEFPKVAAASAIFAGVAAAPVPVGLPITAGTALPKAVPCFVSCATPLPGVWTTTGEPVVKPDAGGFTITGPDGGRDAIAGGGGAVTICGACLGSGTTLRGAGGWPAITPEVAPGRAAGEGLEATPGFTAAGDVEAGVSVLAVEAADAVAGRCAIGWAPGTRRDAAPRSSRSSFCC